MDDLLNKVWELYESERAEVRRLTDLLLHVTAPREETVHIESTTDKVRVSGHDSWPSLRAKLEAQHRKSIDWTLEVQKEELVELTDPEGITTGEQHA